MGASKVYSNFLFNNYNNFQVKTNKHIKKKNSGCHRGHLININPKHAICGGLPSLDVVAALQREPKMQKAAARDTHRQHVQKVCRATRSRTFLFVHARLRCHCLLSPSVSAARVMRGEVSALSPPSQGSTRCLCAATNQPLRGRRRGGQKMTRGLFHLIRVV